MDLKYDSDPVALAATKPDFFDTPHIGRLYEMFVALSEQLAVSNERYDTLVRVLIDEGHVAPSALESYSPTPEVVQARIAQHTAMIKDIFGDLEAEIKLIQGQ